MWDLVGPAIINLLLVIDSVIYGLVATLFSIFVDLANASENFFSDSIIADFTNRLYILVGVVALFIIIYSLLNTIINPDNLTKGKTAGSKIIMNVVTSIILIALVPTIFNFASTIQNAIISDNIIGKAFLGDLNQKESLVNADTSEKIKLDNNYIVKQQGANLSWSVLNAFFYTTDENLSTEWSAWGEWEENFSSATWLTCGGAIILVIGSAVATYISYGSLGGSIPTSVGVASAACAITGTGQFVTGTANELITPTTIYWKGMVNGVRLGDFSLITAFSEEVEAGTVMYLPLVSTIIGVLLLYMIFSYCLDLGIRAVKLAFYQMLAPLPILTRIIPNNKMFNNWLKVTITTYLEIFIRMALLFIVVYLSSKISDIEIFSGVTGGFARMIIIMGIVTFARQAPKLISEITGIKSENMKLGIMEKLGAGGVLAAGALIGGGLTAGVRNFANNWKRTSGNNKLLRFASASKSGLAGFASGSVRSAKNVGFKAKNWGDLKKGTTAGAKIANFKSKERYIYKAEHGGTLSGAIKGRVSDALTGAKQFTGFTNPILDIVQFEEEFIDLFKGYENVYTNGTYNAMVSSLNELKSKIAIYGENAKEYPGARKTLGQARDDLIKEMTFARLKAIRKSTDSAAYAAYNMARQVLIDPVSARRAGISDAFINHASDFVLKKGKVYHADGTTLWTPEQLQMLFEAANTEFVTRVEGDREITSEELIVDASGKLVKNFLYTDFSGLSDSRSSVKSKLTEDKNSIVYKEAKKAEERKKK